MAENSKISWIAIEHGTEHKYAQVKIRRHDRKPKVYENVGIGICSLLENLSHHYMTTVIVEPKSIMAMIHCIPKY